MTRHNEVRINLDAQEQDILSKAYEILMKVLENAGDEQGQMNLHHVDNATDELHAILYCDKCEWSTYA